MPTSVEKIQALRNELAGPPSAEATPDELLLRTAIGMGEGLIERFLPQKPEDLDMFLRALREGLRRLESDPIPEQVAELDHDFAHRALTILSGEVRQIEGDLAGEARAELERLRAREAAPAEAAAAIAAGAADTPPAITDHTLEPNAEAPEGEPGSTITTGAAIDTPAVQAEGGGAPAAVPTDPAAEGSAEPAGSPAAAAEPSPIGGSAEQSASSSAAPPSSSAAPAPGTPEFQAAVEERVRAELKERGIE